MKIQTDSLPLLMRKADVLRWLVVMAPLLNSAHGTTVVAIRAVDHVLVGADSLVKNDEGKQPATHMCKITHLAGSNCVFAFSGSQNSKWGFDVLRIGTAACGVSGDLEAKVTAFEVKVLPQLKRFAAMDRREAPTHYYSKLVNHAVISGVFAAIENQRAVVIQIGYTLSPTGELRKMRIRSDPTTWSKEVFKLGETTEIEVFLQQNDMTWSAIEETGLMRTLLQLEMDSHRDTVGPPISILRMDKTGAHWLPNNRGVCSDIPRPATAKPAKMKQISKADH